MAHLTEPLTLRCGLTLADRVAMAPLTNTQSQPDGRLGDDELRWLVRRARDGFRWISTCATFVSDEGHAWVGQLGIASDAHLPGLTRLADALHGEGALAVVQLHHGGIKADQAPVKLGPVAADGVRGATVHDLARVVGDFAAAARRAEQAGFDGVEVHGANGYLLTQFLAPADNTRTDAYGGDLVGRARLLRETVRAVRASVSPGFAVGVRLNPVDLFAPRGLTLDDSVQVGRWLADDGVDFVHLSLREASGPEPAEPDGVPVVTTFRQGLPAQVALFTVGGIWTRSDAQRALDAGADVAVLGKAAIGHPDWPVASARPGWQPSPPPWTPEFLASVDVGEALIRYVSAFPGMVVGGAPPRG